MISSHDGELELLVYWTGTVSVVSHTGLGGTRASSDVNINFGLDQQTPLLLIVTGDRFNYFYFETCWISAIIVKRTFISYNY